MAIQKTADGKYILKVGDKTLEVDEEQLYTLASKANGADTRFEEAHQKLKSALEKEQELQGKAQEFAQTATVAERKRIRELLQQVSAGYNEDAYGQVLDLYGYEGADREEQMSIYRKQFGGSKSGPAGGGKGDQPPAPALDAKSLTGAIEQIFGASVGEIKELLAYTKQKGQGETRNRVYQALRNEIDSSADWGKLLKNLRGGFESDEEFEAAVEELKGSAESELRSRMRDGAQYSPDLLQDVTKTALAKAQRLGLGKQAKSIGLAASPELAQLEAQAAEPVKPVSPLDPNYNANFATRMLQAMNDR